MRAKHRLRAVMSIRSKLIESSRDWLNKEGFIEVQGPILLPGEGEKPNHFKVDFFGKTAYLSSGLNPYSDTFLGLFDNIYTISPTFRAEKIKSKRHLAEYWRIEAVSKVHFEFMLNSQEKMLQYILRTIVEACSEELAKFNVDIGGLKVKTPFSRITYDEAIERLQEKDPAIFWGQPIDRKMEKALSHLFSQPFFITQFPVSGETLFHKPVPRRCELTLSGDLYAPDGYGEIGACNEQITQKKLLQDRLAALEIDSDEQKWFLDLRFNVGPQSVCVIGVERLLHWLCKSRNISEVTAFPRAFDLNYS